MSKNTSFSDFDEPLNSDNDILTADAPKSRKLNTFTGIFVIIMTIIGIFSTAKFAIDGFIKLSDKSALKNDFSSFVYPVVVTDVPAFDNASQLTPSTLITTGIWNIILSDDNDKYAVDGDYMSVPSIDVDASISSLFGSGITVTHQTVGDFELSFIYDEETKNYSVPVSPNYLPYYPYIDSFTKEKSTYTIKVGYMTPGKYFLSKDENDLPKPIKHMEYTIEKHGSEMKIVSLRTYPASQPSK